MLQPRVLHSTSSRVILKLIIPVIIISWAISRTCVLFLSISQSISWRVAHLLYSATVVSSFCCCCCCSAEVAYCLSAQMERHPEGCVTIEKLEREWAAQRTQMMQQQTNRQSARREVSDSFTSRLLNEENRRVWMEEMETVFGRK